MSNMNVDLSALKEMVEIDWDRVSEKELKEFSDKYAENYALADENVQLTSSYYGRFSMLFITVVIAFAWMMFGASGKATVMAAAVTQFVLILTQKLLLVGNSQKLMSSSVNVASQLQSLKSKYPRA